MGGRRAAGAARFFLAIASLAASLGSRAAAVEADTDSLAAAVKATYLYKLAAFVDWPASTFRSADGPLVICVSGDDGFGTLVERAAKDQKVNDHPIAVRSLPSGTPLAGCHVAFLAGARLASTLEALRSLPVLTVTDNAREPSETGIVNFVLQGGRVRFEISERAASASGLSISSKLLSLAVGSAAGTR